MSRTNQFLSLLLFILLLSSCKKNDPGTGSSYKEMKSLQVSPNFSWETSRDVTFQISSDKSTVISITSEAADVQYYSGYYDGLSSVMPVKLNIPSVVSEVRVNGLPVAISGKMVQVNLSNVLKSGLAYHPMDIPTQGLIAAWHLDENTGTLAHDLVGNHNGVISGAGWVNGINGKALQFDGNTSQEIGRAHV